MQLKVILFFVPFLIWKSIGIMELNKYNFTQWLRLICNLWRLCDAQNIFFVIVDWIINIIIPQIRPEKKVKK